jgi:thioredoxin reductase
VVHVSGGRAIVREAADVAVVGAGPAGLTAATELRRAGAGRVVVLEREAEPGGIPRHARHQGFGVRDLRRAMSGPRYAARIAERATASGAELRTEVQATGWSDDGELELTSPEGRTAMRARAVILATGCRERPRSARLVPGSRPQGVMTTGMLQQLVYLRRERPGRRALVVGAEHVSFSALLTLSHGGARAVAMITELPRHQSLAVIRAGAAVRFRTPLLTRTRLSAIRGRRRVEEVELTDLEAGAIQTLACDLVVFTADWIGDYELAVLGGAALDPATGGPLVDPVLRTSRPGLFAAGNLLHGAETADVAALSGRHVAAGVVGHLDGEPWPSACVPIRCERPLQWISPSAVAALPAGADAAPPRGRFLLRSREALTAPLVELSQDGRDLWRGRPARLGPGRSARLPFAWTRSVDPDGDVIIARVLAARRAPWRPRGRRRAAPK